ncbi:DUF885 domain-containing protein [Neptunicella sp. SCSIO 80796]|uniref:DUF885 domain-containing protein n=1 Tax=Neptunicella plasticusilytica TaxID=3117012 RepID=UPI003A4D577F
MYKTAMTLLIGSLLAGCSQPAPSTSESSASAPETQLSASVDQNTQFDQFKTRFLEDTWRIYPNYGIYVGYYQYDDVLTIPDDQQQQKENAYLQATLDKLNQFELTQLSDSNATDYALIKNQIESTIWYRDSFKSDQWDPSNFNVASAFGVILNTDYKPLDERLLAVLKRLQKVPAYYAAAKQNITQPTLEHTDLAIQQSKGALGIFTESIPTSLQQSSLSDQQKQQFEPLLAASVEAINDYIAFLQDKRSVLVDGGAKDFRIGEVLYEQKFKYDIVSDYTAKELYQKAIEAKQKLHQDMISITEQLWPKYFPDSDMPAIKLQAVKQLIDHLSVNHVKRDEFVDEIRRQMPIIEDYIIQHDLLDMDPTRPLVVRETPEYQRGVAGASVNAPGPYDATANTYYNVTPLDDYTDEQAESYLREYNHWILQILNIHEALPGHYTQLVHANKSPSKIKSILGNGAMIEGWAVYAEKMMLESGYGNNEPEMWLMYDKWNLRVVVNTILDYSVQVLGMTKEDALDLLINEAFQQQTEAEGKWRRATLSQVQLTSYFNGFAEIYAFREELKQKMADKFDLKIFHNQFLSYGNAPVPVIRKLMLKELNL